MIARSYIENNLKMLDKKYRKASGLKESFFYSKLAIIELCGWIEESMDDVILRCAKRQLREPTNLRFVEKQVVQRTYGFDYEDHFRKMLIQLLGIVRVEKIERLVDNSKHSKLVSTLSSLKSVRNSEAHTHIKDVTKSINAPSVTLGQFFSVYEGLTQIEKILRSKSI